MMQLTLFFLSEPPRPVDDGEADQHRDADHMLGIRKSSLSRYNSTNFIVYETLGSSS